MARFGGSPLDHFLLLPPPPLHDWLPEGHLARLVAPVAEELDLGPILCKPEDG